MLTVTVQPGASLWSLAAQYLGNGDMWPLIYQANPQLAPNPDLVIAGQQLRIPQTRPNRQAEPVILIAGALLTAVSAAAAYELLKPELSVPGQLERMALQGALDAVYGMPPERTEGFGAASARVARLNLVRRAQFVVSASKRITLDLQRARAENRSLRGQLGASVQREKRYFSQHIAAIYQRTQAAALTDSAADTYGDLLGWNTVRDSRASAECVAADKHNFRASDMPEIGFPGGVHPHCRCYPGPPYPGAKILPGARMAVAA